MAKEKETYKCPLCQAEMVAYLGTQVNPNDPAYGVTLDCPNKACPAQEVAGHGDNAEKAFNVVMQKFGGKR